MPAPKNPRQAAVKEAIRKHLASAGSAGWQVVIDQFPDVSPSSMWRWIKEAKADGASRPDLVNARSKIAASIKNIRNDRVVEMRENKTEKIARQIPAGPSPAYVAKNGEQAIQQLDFASEIHALYADAMMLREASVKRAEDGSEAIKNPVLFERQIARRTSLIETGIRTIQELWDLRTMQAFYETIITEIGKESPECQRRILARLQELNARQGMTMFMRV